MSQRRIAHLDMDAFYASVELLRRPELRGLPVAIGGRGDPGRRGVVTTATYEARAYGIRSGMALRRAAELCPACVFLPVDFDEYRRYSRRFKAAIAEVTPRIEDRGIDEVYLDLTGLPGVDADGGAAQARDLKRRVHEATGLSCSIGVAPNKLLAKIASDLDKPDGLTLIDEPDIAGRIWALPVRRINGIGPKADARLQAQGIRTIGELAATPADALVERFGPHYGRFLHDAAHGRDQRPIVVYSEPQSISRETTFERDMHPRRDWHALAATLARLCRQLNADLAARRYEPRTIGVKVRYDDFRIATRGLSLAQAVRDEASLRKAAFECLARLPLERRLRLVGVRAGGLARAGSTTAEAMPTGGDAARSDEPPRAEAREPAPKPLPRNPTLPLFD
jgi:DNA polymerase-4